ncbi:MAG: sensor domain-containing diguanylate cyclase [Bacillota bacterium]|nr:sensor domain-containing diguanylate cyclase [Bacillota bacterium]
MKSLLDLYREMNAMERLHEFVRAAVVAFVLYTTWLAFPELFRANQGFLLFSAFLYILLPLNTASLAEGGKVVNYLVTASDLALTVVIYWLAGGRGGFGAILYFLTIGWATTRYSQTEAFIVTLLVALAYVANHISVLTAHWSLHLLLTLSHAVAGMLALGAYTYAFAETVRVAETDRRKKELLLRELKASFQEQAAVAAELEKANLQLKQHAQALEQSRSELIKRNRELALLAEILKVLGSTLEVEVLLSEALDKVVELMEAERSLVFLREQEEEKVLTVAAAAPSDTFWQQVVIHSGQGLLGQAVEQCKPLLWRRGQPGPLWSAEPSPREEELTSVIATPLKINQAVSGLMVLLNHRRGYFSPAELEFFGLIAGQFSLALEKAFLYRQVKLQAITDSLTGLYNFRHFQQRLREELARARRHGIRVSLLMIDLDWFKEFNDTYGHPQGDLLLRRVAQAFRESVREGDVVARYGGEEFVIILPDTGQEEAVCLAERLCEVVRRNRWEVGQKGDRRLVTCSIGVATFPDDARTPEGLIRVADEALYEAKREGKDRVRACRR